MNTALATFLRSHSYAIDDQQLTRVSFIHLLKAKHLLLSIIRADNLQIPWMKTRCTIWP